MTPVDGGWIPDFNSRYFTADFPYGLAILEAFGDMIGCDIPNIKETMNWYDMVSKSVFRFDLKRYAIRNIDDVYSFYGESSK